MKMKNDFDIFDLLLAVLIVALVLVVIIFHPGCAPLNRTYQSPRKTMHIAETLQGHLCPPFRDRGAPGRLARVLFVR